jgi:feruloyl esterase
MRLKLALVCAAAGAALATAAQAAPTCTAEALNALRVAGVTVTEAKPVAAADRTPAYCQVLGVMVTKGEGLPEGLARFSMQLPDLWGQRFMAYGVGGNAGGLNPSANATDRAAAVGKGYVTIVNDSGHVGSAGWVRRPDGGIDRTRVIDFFYRANHSVTVAGKALAQAYYAAPVLHAYFNGCSTGGRMAMSGAIHYPDDYAGIIVGDPSMDYTLGLARLLVMKAVLESPKAYIPQHLLVAIDNRVTGICDGIDGAKDGLVQNPAACPVKAEDLLCKPGEKDACLNLEQVNVVRNFTLPMRDKRRNALYSGWPITHLSGAGGMAAWDIGRGPPNLIDPKTPWDVWDEKTQPSGWTFAKQTFGDWMGYGPKVTPSDFIIDTKTQVIDDKLLQRNAEVFSDGVVNDPARMKPFFAKGGKMILYHGTADPALPYSRSVVFYEQLTALLGVAKVQDSARFFTVPGMQHCQGGIGPDRFDTLTALEAWVEQGKPPEVIAASTRPEAVVQHRLPLCPYPLQGRYRGTGDIMAFASWSCKPPGATR